MTPEPRHDVEGQADFSVVSWRMKGDDLWLHHKAGGNKKANLYELALVGEIEALRAERPPPSPAPAALGTPEGEILERLRSWHTNCLGAQSGRPLHQASWGILASVLQDAIETFTPLAERSASQARTIAALCAALDEITTACEEDCGVPTEADGDEEPVAATQAEHGPITGSRLTFGILRRSRRALKEHPNG